MRIVVNGFEMESYTTKEAIDGIISIIESEGEYISPLKVQQTSMEEINFDIETTRIIPHDRCIMKPRNDDLTKYNEDELYLERCGLLIP